jgi:hypothetical protein
MHAFDNAPVPVLRRFVFWISNGENRRRDTLPIKLCNFPVAKRLPEGWEPLEKISELRHQRNDGVVLTTHEHQ